MLILETMCDKCVPVSMSRSIVKKAGNISRHESQSINQTNSALAIIFGYNEMSDFYTEKVGNFFIDSSRSPFVSSFNFVFCGILSLLG